MSTVSIELQGRSLAELQSGLCASHEPDHLELVTLETTERGAAPACGNLSTDALRNKVFRMPLASLPQSALVQRK